MDYLTRDLIAARDRPYNGRMLQPGDRFTALSQVDYDYLVSRGQAMPAPEDAAAQAPAAAPAAEPPRGRGRRAAAAAAAPVAPESAPAAPPPEPDPEPQAEPPVAGDPEQAPAAE